LGHHPHISRRNTPFFPQGLQPRLGLAETVVSVDDSVG
jgi:hypothetical protein